MEGAAENKWWGCWSSRELTIHSSHDLHSNDIAQGIGLSSGELRYSVERSKRWGQWNYTTYAAMEQTYGQTAEAIQ